MVHVREAGPSEEVLDVRDRSRHEVVDRDHGLAALEQALAQMRAEEAGATGDDDAAAALAGRGHQRPMPW